MIFGHLEHSEFEVTLPNAIKKGLDFLRSHDLVTLATGRYDIDGDNMFAIVAETSTEPTQDRKPEAHHEYADIQYLVSGEEAIQFATFDETNPVCTPYDADKDIYFMDSIKHSSQLVLAPKNFVVFYPNQAHTPCCALNEPLSIKKVIIKIHKSQF